MPCVGSNVDYGVASIIGKSRAIKDAVMVVPAFTRTACGHQYDLFVVYDGPDNSHSFRRLDAEVTASKELISKYDGVMQGFAGMVGSTSLVAVVGENRIVVANCGVSPAVLSRGGRTVAISSEMQRIEEARGKATTSEGCSVWGVLVHSIDREICKPEVTVTVMERVDEDEFLIIASDGLWDVISIETACKIVRKCFLTGSTPKETASLLTTFAISRNSRNNISVIVIQLSTQIRSFND
ncbi:hypothetical protein LUZ61_010695 [Rhynchospora tenuis]|uniref:protein-serine/threonine phosphatase n=1 Tax=Rhynchospora tenuis TaxID=198213 RepID=A0AAD6EZR0_9POAL|nr:hypothetical protein LUZ61_010695 [Rhynchospora tenuis]